jgi:RimJ/RimL family protein N-acetyltransferase
LSISKPVTVTAEGLLLREWRAADVPVMVTLFDTAEMERWTPLAHPFDAEAATAYVQRAHKIRADGVFQFAITEGGDEPLGEVLIVPTDIAGTCELAYAVGAQYRGKQLAARAVRALLPFARTRGFSEARLLIAVDNPPSQRVATAAGFVRTDLPLVRKERKIYVLDLATWTTPV